MSSQMEVIGELRSINYHKHLLLAAWAFNFSSFITMFTENVHIVSWIASQAWETQPKKLMAKKRKQPKKA